MWLDIVITKILLKNRELKTGWPFLREGRGNGLTNERTSKMTWCEQLLAPSYVIAHIL
jgi:hypothetical protein